MNAEMFAVTRRFAVGTHVDLFQIDCTAIGGPIYYFTNNVFEERFEIKFGGQTYTHMAISMDDTEVDSQAGPAQPRLQIVTAGGPVAAILRQYNDLRSAIVYRFTTFAEFLDEMPDPDTSGAALPNPSADSNAVIGLEMFVVDRKIGADDQFAELQLVAPTDQEGVELPLRIVRKRWCDSEYRHYNATTDTFTNAVPEDGGCPWRGANNDDLGPYFDENDQPTTKDKDRCSKMVTGCLCRFGKTNALPMAAFPGIRSAQEA